MIRVTDVRFTRADAATQRTGLLGYVAFDLDGELRLDGVTLRRTADARLALSFPARRDRRGRDHPYVRPLSKEAREAIEAQVLATLNREELAPWL